MGSGIAQGRPFKVALPKGVNFNDDQFAVDPRTDCVAVENVSLSFNGLRVRNGESTYINKAYANPFLGILGMHRYRNSAGTKKVIISANGVIMGDSDNGNFDTLTSITKNGDGFVDFEQYRNSMGMFSELADEKWYNSLAATTVISPTIVPRDFSTGITVFNATPATTGGFLLDKKYTWRMTFGIKHGTDFLAETQATGVPHITPGGITWDNYFIDWGGGTTTNKVTFVRPTDVVVDAIPAYVDTVYIYRSPPLDSFVPLSTGFGAYLEYTDLYRIGSISMATVRGLAAGADMFVDDGVIQLGPETPQISYGLRWYPIRSRYNVMHKGRLWKTYCSIAPNAQSATYSISDIDGVYYSRFINNGEEPIAFQSAAPKISIDPFSGEGNTGLASWRGKVLLVFKPKSTHAIYGGDDSITTTLLNVQKEILSPTIGCIAPATIVQAEGAIMWVSHRGPEIFDGTGPHPLNSEDIKGLFDIVPASRKRMMTAYYDSQDREYVVFFSHPDYPVGNRRAVRYSFITRKWTMDRYARGIGTAIEINDSDTSRRLLFGYDDTFTFFNDFDNDPIIVYGKQGYRNGTKLAEPLEWSVDLAWQDAGDATLDKFLPEVSVEGAWADSMNVHFKATTPTSIINTEGHKTDMGTPPSGRGISKKTILNPGEVKGKRILVGLSGSTASGQTDVTGVYLHFTEPLGRA